MMQSRQKGAGLAQLQSGIHAGLIGADAVGAASGAAIQCVPLLVQEGKWLLPCADIAKIVVIGKLSSIPGGAACLRGVMAVSGTLYTLVDLGQILFGEASRLTIKSRAVCLENRVAGANMALLVDRALDIRSVAFASHDVFEVGADVASQLLVDTVELDGEPAPVTSAQRLFEVTARQCGVDGAVISAA